MSKKYTFTRNVHVFFQLVCQFVSVIALTWAEKQCASLRQKEKKRANHKRCEKQTTKMPLNTKPHRHTTRSSQMACICKQANWFELLHFDWTITFIWSHWNQLSTGLRVASHSLQSAFSSESIIDWYIDLKSANDWSLLRCTTEQWWLFKTSLFLLLFKTARQNWSYNGFYQRKRKRIDQEIEF